MPWQTWLLQTSSIYLTDTRTFVIYNIPDSSLAQVKDLYFMSTIMTCARRVYPEVRSLILVPVSKSVVFEDSRLQIKKVKSSL